ncbi:hypothetical protein FRC02_002884 [Tulasnella sp. 418]|nr:hypothetical protein FRC02_002884 [Tulasnella sp. 418]
MSHPSLSSDQAMQNTLLRFYYGATTMDRYLPRLASGHLLRNACNTTVHLRLSNFFRPLLLKLLEQWGHVAITPLRLLGSSRDVQYLNGRKGPKTTPESDVSSHLII